MSSLDLESLVAASREAAGAGAGSDAALCPLRLPEVAAHARSLLSAMQLHKQQQQERGESEPTAEEGEVQASQQQELLLCLRVMRNTAAAGPAAAAAVLQAGLLQVAATTLNLLASVAIALNWELPAALAQALANLCNASAPAAAAAWSALFPLHISLLAHVNTGPTQSATCLALLACCRAVEGAAAALTGEQGSEVMTALLCNHQRMLQQGEQNDTLGLLAAHLCFQRDLLPHLFASLGASTAQASSGAGIGGSVSAPPALQPTMAQAALLELLCAEAQDGPQQVPQGQAGRHGDASSSRQGGVSMLFLTDLAQQLAVASKAAPLSPGQQQVLQEALRLMRDLCARDDSGRGLAGGADLVGELQGAQALPTLLAMLKALAPIKSQQQQRQAADAAAAGSSAAGASSFAGGGAGSPGSEGAGSSGSAGGIQMAELAPQLAVAAGRFPAVQPYPGFRSDLLAALANAAHSRPAVQEEVGRLGGVELVLAQCQTDRESPWAREWALWGVRNLCDGNTAAQEAIRQLQLCTTVESEEGDRLGVKVEMDPQTGKLRVTKREPPPGASTATAAGAAAPAAGTT